jgi:thioredoxin-dependent peroxiredoxin
VESHRKFREKFSLPFHLVVDEGHRIADAYGVWKEKSMYGKKYWGNARTTFLIGRDGEVARVFENVKPDAHTDEVAEAIAALPR